MSIPIYRAVVPVISTSIYAAGDALGGRNTLANVASPGIDVVLTDLTIVDLANQKSALTLMFFSSEYTAPADNAAFAISDADLKSKFLGQIPVVANDYKSLNTNAQAVATLKGINKRIFGTKGKNIYMQIVCDGTPTYGALGDLNLQLIFIPVPRILAL
jgi:hypothetical protein